MKLDRLVWVLVDVSKDSDGKTWVTKKKEPNTVVDGGRLETHYKTHPKTSMKDSRTYEKDGSPKYQSHILSFNFYVDS